MSFDYSSIDSKKAASFNQIKAIAVRFSGKGFKALKDSEKPDWNMQRSIVGILWNIQKLAADPTVKDSKPAITHGEVQKLFKADKLPAKYSDLYDADKIAPKKEKKAKKAAKPATDAMGIIAQIAALPDSEKAAFKALMKEMLKD